MVIGQGGETMASVVGRLLRERGHTLSTAESCTGGMIGAMITSEPGASEYYLGGVVAYANAVKQGQLGVPPEILAEHGAVSEPVAEAMARGCREQFASDWALSVTGIAGPAGGTDEKPVGLVYTALAGPHGCDVHRHVFPAQREHIRRRTSMTALNYLRLAMKGK